MTNRDRLGPTVHLTSRDKIERRSRRVQTWLWLGVALVLGCSAAFADELKDAEELYLSGNYPGCAEAAQQMVRHRPASEDWQILLSQALLASGKYPEAYTAMTNARPGFITL